MRIYSEIKKAGIDVIQQLNQKEVVYIASNIASKLCLAFPEHNLNRKKLISSLSTINMYIANMPEDYSSAKYFYKNNSIYFKRYSTPEEMSTIAVHECIHFIQEITDEKYNLVRMGLYKSDTGLAMNEAAVQIMASEANNFTRCKEKYYGINIRTISPDYYPLQCALLSQMAFFTGSYPLYHSTLYSDDIFENTFNMFAGEKVYTKICKCLDSLLILENNLSYYTKELQFTDNIRKIKRINHSLEKTKESIRVTFFEAQNLIVSSCFTQMFRNIRNLSDIKIFQKQLYRFQRFLGTTENYTFYTEFYNNIIFALESKRNYIINYGDINLFMPTSTQALMTIGSEKNFLQSIKFIISKIKKLFGFEANEKDTNIF